MNAETDKSSGKALSNRTVLIVFGSVILALTITFACVGAGWVALAVPVGFLAVAVAAILFQIAYQRVIFPLVAVLVVGVVRLVKLASGKKENCQPGAPPNGGPATQLGNSGVTKGPSSVS